MCSLSCVLNLAAPALQVCTEAQREELLKRVHSHLIALRKLTYGKHIVGRVEKLLINTASPASKVCPQACCGTLTWEDRLSS